MGLRLPDERAQPALLPRHKRQDERERPRQPERLGSDIRQKLLSQGLSTIETGCRAAEEALVLVAFKRPVDEAPGDRGQWWAWQCEVYTRTSVP